MKRFLFAALIAIIAPVDAEQSFAADEVIFSDDFSDLRPGWGAASELVNVADNKLVVKPNPNTIRRELYRAKRFHDADIQLQVVQRKGDLHQTAGLIFWANDFQNYYFAAVQSDGKFFVGRYMGNKLLAIVPLILRDEIKQGLGEPNQLRVVTGGDSAVIYVGDKEATRLKGYPPLDGGFIGVHSESGAEASTWEYSGLSVRRGSPPADYKPRDAALLYADDFATLAPDWGAPNKLNTVRDGKLHVTVSPGYIRTLLCSGSFFENVDAQIEVGAEQGDEDYPGGLAFWAADYDNYYVARLRPNGSVAISRRSNGRFLTAVSSRPVEGFNTGLGKVNKLRVVTAGRTAVVYVNDREALRFKGFPPEGPSRIGVSAAAGKAEGVWSFDNLIVRPGPPPLATDKLAEGILFADDFVTADPGWGEPDEYERAGDGKLLFTMNEGKSRITFYQGRLFNDADIRVKLRQIAGSTTIVAGLIFWGKDLDNYCSLNVRADGNFLVYRKVEGKVNNPVQLTQTEAVKTGLRQVNDLRVVTKGKTATIYVNDKEVASFEGDDVLPAKEGSSIGFYASGGGDIGHYEFTDLVVREPK